jgi:hypothetical protein
MKPIRRRAVWMRIDKGKESFQDMLQHEGIDFQISRNPYVKYSVIERSQHTIRGKLYKYFTYKNTYRFIGVLQQFVQGYNASV